MTRLASTHRAASHASGAAAPGDTPPEVIWHELECGAYRADLPLWLELAAEHPSPVLEIGAGCGRVTVALAKAGSSVTALDLDPTLLVALEARTSGLAVEVVVGDARSFALAQRDFGLCLVPMQTLQLLGGAAGRKAFLAQAHAHLRAGGLLACALLSTLEPFDCATGDVGPFAERVAREGITYISRATRVSIERGHVEIERERRTLPDRPSAAPTHVTSPERNLIRLDHLSAKQLEAEAREAGFRCEPRREVPATNDHVGSVVVMLRA